VSVGRRDVLVQLFSYQDGGSGGFMASEYLPIKTPTGGRLWWGRKVDQGGSEELLGEKARQIQPIVVALAWEAPVDLRGIMRVGGLNYRITNVSEKPQAYERHVTGEWAQENTFTVVS
jgi:hypothetical protein